MIKNLPVSARDARETGLIPGSGRPLCFYMENSIDREAWQATIYAVTKDSDMTERIHTHASTVTLLKAGLFIKHLQMKIKIMF